jgi:integrase
MPRRAKGLTAALVEKGTTPGRYGDGGGLYLLVRAKDVKFWLFRYTRAGRMREMGLGPAKGQNAVKLAEARAKARGLHAVVREGRDPLAERDAEKAKAEADEAKAKAAAMTFRDVAGMYINAHQASWRSAKHRRQWNATLDQYALPLIGSLPVSDIDVGAVMRVIEPLWRDRTETASRLRGRIESVLSFAKARSWREGENPARWRGHLDQLLPPRRKVQRVEHHRALPWRELGGFMQRLRQISSISARCLEFLVLTACRSGEARGARWSEIDLSQRLWVIPASRMKSAREHRVPLSEAAMAVLRGMAHLGTEGLVFPGLKGDAPLADKTLAKAMADTGGEGTVHGMRSTFRDWCAEATSFPREVAEAALAHALPSSVESAYLRSDVLAKRRMLMQQWAEFCSRPMPQGEVVLLHRAT